MRASAPFGFVVATLLAGAAALWPAQDPVGDALHRYERDRAKLAGAINEQRAEEGLGPLSPEPRLTRAAQEVALAIARRMKAHATFEEAVHDGELEDRVAAAGYETHALAVRFAVIAADATDVAFRLVGGGRELRRSDLPEVGIGIAPTWGSRVYVVVAALSAGDHFAAETTDLDDLERVRARLMERINQARRESQTSPLEPNDCLARVAQTHAERMLAQGFLAHTALGEGGLEDRVRAGGCPQEVLGETMAKGQTHIDEIVEEWLTSPENRRMLLDPGFDAAGLGLAMGRGADGYATVWVQVLGASTLAAP